MKTTTYQPKSIYPFANLSPREKFEIVAFDPSVQILAAELPIPDRVTKPMATNAIGLVLLGLASIIFDSDARADAVLRSEWDHFRKVFDAVGARTSSKPLNLNMFRYWRDDMTSPSDLETLNHTLESVLSHLAVGQARDIGLLDAAPWDGSGDDGWLSVPRERVVMADGTWFKELATKDRRPSERTKRTTRSANKVPRESEGVDSRGRAHGYAHTVMAVRGDKPNQHIVLGITRAHGGNEMEPVLAKAARLRDAIPDVELGFVYDGAMRGVHRRYLRVDLGMLAINKRHGSDGFKYRQCVGREVTSSASQFDITLHGTDGSPCKHHLAITEGVCFRTDRNHIGKLTYGTALPVEYVHRHSASDPDESFGWTVGFSVRCDQHDDWHVLEVDPNLTKFHGIYLPEHLLMVPPSHDEFWRIYGYRNAAESMMNYLKFAVMDRDCAASFTARRHEFDLLLAVTITNALAWAQHGSRYKNSSLKKCGHERRERCQCAPRRKSMVSR